MFFDEGKQFFSNFYKLYVLPKDMKSKEGKENFFKKFISFMKKDSWQSLIVFLVLALVFIKFIFFPLLNFITGTAYPLVIVESCSMYHHEEGFDLIFNESDVYSGNDIRLEDSLRWDFQNGLKKGDVIFSVKPKNIEIGDVIIFEGGTTYPIIHRIVDAEEPYATKGDNYKTNSYQLPVEKSIKNEQIYGKAIFKIPAIGWIKLIFFDWRNPPTQRGFCN